MQLQIDPAVDAHRHNLLNIAGPWTEGKAIERVHRAPLFVRAGVGGLIFLLREQLRNRAGEAQAQQKQRKLTEAGSHEDSRDGAGLPDYEPSGGKVAGEMRFLERD